MKSNMTRRRFLQNAATVSAGASLVLQEGAAAGAPPTELPSDALDYGTIGDIKVSRLLLGGNLLTHYTHSRDLKYVYNLTAHYNTPQKIIDTMALAEKNGINTLVVHTVPLVMQILKKYRYEQGGKMQWIICPTAPIEPGLAAYTKQVDTLIEMGVDAIYLWGVRGDQLVSQGKMDLLKQAVDVVKKRNIPSGVGGHDLRVVSECEKHGVDADFYIKTFHHHSYPTGPKPEEIKGPTGEIPGYWCSNPDDVARVMQDVKKPWIGFKVMAAGAIPPEQAFPYVVKQGVDHILAGMFDFEIETDAKLARKAFAENRKRKRPWRS